MVIYIKGIKHIWVMAILLIVFTFIFKFFESTPYQVIFFKFQALLLLMFIVFLFVYITDTVYRNRLPDKIHMYFIVMMILVPVYSSFRASSEFGQPLMYGVLSERQWLVISVMIWISYAISNLKITHVDLEKSFLYMAWVSLTVFTLMSFLFDPSLLDVNEKLSKMVEITESRGTRFRFQTYFITFGAIYYFIAYDRNKRFKDFILMMCFISYIAFIVQGRTYMVALALTYIVYIVMNKSMPSIITIILKIMVLSIFAAIAINYLSPDYLERMSYMFTQMTQVLSGHLSEDDSANARILTSIVVVDYFNANPISLWLGTGMLSHQWHDGYSTLFGYFYPADIGLLGGVFLYGLVGLVFIFLIPLFLVIKVMRNTRYNDVFIISLKYLLIFYVSKSLQGSFYFGYVGYMLPFFILHAYNKLSTKYSQPFVDALQKPCIK